ncbi:MAG: hypothetical protein QOD87_1535 [Pseudonocardiales bacterium]|nr:hypothetical protein [Pseudonocardiales bacterium]
MNWLTRPRPGVPLNMITQFDAAVRARPASETPQQAMEISPSKPNTRHPVAEKPRRIG